MKMKKIILCLCIILLTGCQNQDRQQKNEPSATVKDENLVLKEWKYVGLQGDSNEKGYYLIKNREDGISNINYYDYETCQEVVLCNKPECKHIDETCTAYLFGGSYTYEIFVYQDHLYIIENNGMAISLSAEREELGPGIMQMDLDGQNRKEIYRMKDGFEFEHGSFVVGDDTLYIPFVKNEMVETAKNQSMQISSEKYLYSISLKTGKASKIMDMKYKNMMGVYGRSIIMNSYHFDEDPQTYFDQKEYDKYDRAIMTAKMNYAVLDIDSKEVTTIDAMQDEVGYFYNNKIYSVEGTALYELDFKTNSKNKIVDLPDNKYTISMIIKNTVILEKWDDQFIGTYKIALANPQIEELRQYTRAPKQAVQILSEMSDTLLTVYDRDGQEEKTWAGTMQYETKEEYIGLISIDDYLNNQNNYQTIKTLTKKRVE